MNCSPPGPSVHGDSPGKNTGVGFQALLQGIVPTWGSNPRLLCPLHWRANSLPLSAMRVQTKGEAVGASPGIRMPGSCKSKDYHLKTLHPKPTFLGPLSRRNPSAKSRTFQGFPWLEASYSRPCLQEMLPFHWSSQEAWRWETAVRGGDGAVSQPSVPWATAGRGERAW